MKTFFFPARALLAGAALVSFASASSAQTDDARYQKLEAEVRELRQQMSAQQEQHARELAELKALLLKQMAATTPAASAATSSVAQASVPQPSLYDSLKQTASGSASPASLYDSLKQSAATLVPSAVAGKGADLDLSVVLDTYFYHDTADQAGTLPNRMSGFQNANGEGSDNGFNLREVELGLSAAVDPYFRAWATVSVEEDGASFEEAVLQSTSLPYGLTLSAGKIKSGIGRLNRQHSHVWDFLDTPLVYRAMFGDEGLADDGVQLTWLAPTPFYLLFGTEVFNGNNDQSFSDLSGDHSELPSHDAPRLYTAFMKTGPDLGPNHALQFGLSALAGRQQVWDEDAGAGASGESQIYGSDFVYKYDAMRSHGEGDVTVQGEYFYRNEDLDRTVGLWEGMPAWTASQDGYYVQGLYGFLPRWKTGLRWDQVGVMNDVHTPDDGDLACDDSYRLTTVLDWQLSEFSLLRLQAGRGWYATDDGREAAWECALEWQVTFGKHPAHDF